MAIESVYQVLLRPHLTEKATDLQELGQYSFVVVDEATKRDIKKAVESILKLQSLKFAQ